MFGDKLIKKGYVEPAPLGLDRVPFLPYGFQVSRFGGLIRSDARRWYTNQAVSGMNILIGRYVQPTPEEIKIYGTAKTYMLKNGWVITSYKQAQATNPFNLTSNSLHEVGFKLHWSALKDRRMLQAIISVAREYQAYFDEQSEIPIKVTYAIYWLREDTINGKTTLERRRVSNINGLMTALVAGLKTKAGSNAKLQSANPKIDAISSTEFEGLFLTPEEINNTMKEKAPSVQKDESNVGVCVSPSFETEPTESDMKDVKKYKELNESEFYVDTGDLLNNAGHIYNINSKRKNRRKERDRFVKCMSSLEVPEDTYTKDSNTFIFRVGPDDIKVLLNDNVVGTICVRDNCIKNLWVEPIYRGNGLSRQLMERCIKLFNPSIIRPEPFTTSPITKENSDNSLTLEQLKEFYKKFGFVDKNGVMIRNA